MKGFITRGRSGSKRGRKWSRSTSRGAQNTSESEEETDRSVGFLEEEHSPQEVTAQIKGILKTTGGGREKYKGGENKGEVTKTNTQSQRRK